MKKICNLLNEKRISYGMIIFFFLSLLPIIILGFYNYPCADDFSASDTAYLAWKNTGSIFSVIKAAWENVVFNYLEWSGVFMSVFWTSLQPGIFGEHLYGITTLIAVVLFVIGGFYLGYVIFEKYLKADKYLTRCIVVLYLFTSIQCMPDGNEGLYWHAGVVNYTWAFAFLLLLSGLVLSIYKEENDRKKIVKVILACILGVFVGGGNYLTALQGSLWLMLISAIGCLLMKYKQKVPFITACKKSVGIFLPTISIIAAFVVSVLAPGNAVRMSVSSGMNPVKAVLVSFHYFLNDPIEEWLTWPVVFLLAIAIPFMWHMAGKTEFSFAYPGIVALLGFCMTSAAFTPNLYAQGDVGGGRLADTIYFIWIFWIYAVVCYVVGWVRKNLMKDSVSNYETLSVRSKIYILGLTCLWLGFSALTIMIDEGTYIGTLAGDALLSGQASQYKAENKARLELLHDDSIQDVVLQGFSNPPQLLIFQDIAYDENEWLNQVMAQYYGKGSVRRE